MSFPFFSWTPFYLRFDQFLCPFIGLLELDVVILEKHDE